MLFYAYLHVLSSFELVKSFCKTLSIINNYFFICCTHYNLCKDFHLDHLFRIDTLGKSSIYRAWTYHSALRHTIHYCSGSTHLFLYKTNGLGYIFLSFIALHLSQDLFQYLISSETGIIITMVFLIYF